MDWLGKIIKYLTESSKVTRRWKQCIFTLAAIIVFGTTYALILPAITIDRNSVDSAPGMYMEGETGNQVKNGESILHTASADNTYEVTVDYSRAAGLADAQSIEVEKIGSNDPVYSSYRKKLTSQLESGKLTALEIFSLTFRDENGQPVAFRGNAKVTITYNKALKAGKDSEIRAFSGLMPENAVWSGVRADRNDDSVKSISYQINKEGITGIAVISNAKVSEADKEEKAEEASETAPENGEKAEEIGTSEEVAEQSESEQNETEEAVPEEENDEQEKYTLTASDDSYKVTMTYGEDSGIPSEGAELKVSEIEEKNKDFESYIEKAESCIGEDKVISHAKLYDITILVDGKEFEPQAPVQVRIEANDMPKDKAAEISMVHIPEEGKAEVLGDKDVELEKKKDTVKSVDFTAESFSVYGILYTVDFTWKVDGKDYEYKLVGGGSIGLRSLIDLLGVFENTDPTLSLRDSEDSYTADDFIKDIETVEFSNEDLLKVVQITEDTTAGDIKDQLNLSPEYSGELTKEQKAEMDAVKFKALDWALFSMKSFSSDEKLTIKMKNGEEWTIKVTDPVTDTNPNNMQVLNTADTRSQGIKMWLFDYDLDHSLDNQDNKANTDNNKQDGINAESDYKFLGWGAGNKNNDASGINDFTGLDNDNGNNIRALQGIVQNSLDGGYPVLNTGTSLAYLFDPTADTADRVVYGGNKDQGNINGLFEYKNGYYTYDSDEHYAELNSDNTNFTVYTSTLAQTNKNGQNHNPPRAAGFFPFDTYAHVYNDLKYENDWQHYDDYGTLYLNPDGDQGRSGLNHHLGVAMEMEFVIPKDGVDDNGNPIEFVFSGDDDMWVFIDDQLVLDIGGLHQPVDGIIDFSTGIATITGKATQAGHADNTGANAIVTAEGAQNPRGNNFEFYQALNMPNGGDGKTHTMKIFYVERGGCDSNCMISFNLPLVKGKADVKVAKYDHSSNPVSPLKGVKFGLYTDAACTDLIEEIPTDENGLLLFESLAIKNDDQKYYLKETTPLPGYKANDTIYTLEVAEDGSGNYYFKVMADGQEIETIGEEPAIPVIYNEPYEPIDLTVEKKWQDQSGHNVEPDSNMSATFQVKRYQKYEGEVSTTEDKGPDTTLNIYTLDGYGNNPQLVSTSHDYVRGKTVTISWKYDGYYGWSKYYRIDSGQNVNTGNNVSIEVSIPDEGVRNVYICDGNRGTQYRGVYDLNISGETGARIIENTTEHVESDWEEDLDYTGPTLTLPDDKIDEDHPWTGKFEDLPYFKREGDLTYTYKYYIVETEKTPANATRVYVDGSGNEISDPSALQTDHDSTQTVINKLPEGSLTITKNIKTNGQIDATKTGTFYYAVYKEPYDKDASPAQTPVRTGSIEITENGTKTVTESGLLHGTYYVYELTGAGGTPIVSGDNGTYQTINNTVYNVTGSGTSSTVSETTGSVTLNNDHETVSKTATKTWSDNKEHPTIYFKLFYEKTTEGDVEDIAVEGAEFKELENGVTSVTWDDLPKYDENGQEYVYIVKEYIEKAGGELTVGDKQYTNAAPEGYHKSEDGLNVNNDTSEDYNPKTTYSGKKHWVDTQNGGATRPDSLQVTLYADDVETDKTPVWTGTDTADWTYTFSDLPVFASDGHAIQYRVEETLKPGYTADDPVIVPTDYRMKDEQADPLKYEPNTVLDIPLTSDIDLGYIGVKKGNVHMVWTQRPIDGTVKQKIIDDLNQTEGLGFNNEVTMENTTFVSGIPGEFVWEKGTLTVTWKATDKKIHLQFGKKSQWSLIAYGKYEFEYASGSTDFTNRLNTTEVTAEKDWIDSSGQQMTPVDGTTVTFDLFVNGIPQNKPIVLNGKIDVSELSDDPEVAKTQEVNADAVSANAYEKEAWKAYWGNLPTHDKNGQEITYTIKETVIPAGFDNQNPDGVAAEGTITNKQIVIDINILKVNSESPAQPLTGAKFRLDQYDSERKEVIKSWDETEVSSETGKEGTLSFSGLGIGKYTLVETKSPTGYLKASEDPEFEVIDVNGILTVQFEDVPGKVTYNPENKTFTVHNEPGAELPHAGGIGTTRFILFGSLSMMFAAAGMLLMRKRGEVNR